MLTVMLAPLSFNYSYVWLIFPFTFLISIVVDSGRSKSQRNSAARTLIASVALLSLSILSQRGSAAYGNIFFAGLVAFIGLGLWERRGTFFEQAQAKLINVQSKPHVLKNHPKSRRNRVRAS